MNTAKERAAELSAAMAETHATYETLDAERYWIDQTLDATQWRTRVFGRRQRAQDAIKRFDIEATASAWEGWCGVSQWSIALREFGALGGQCESFGGRPRSASAIGLTFALYRPNGSKLPCDYRLKDITDAIATLKNETGSDREHVAMHNDDGAVR